MLQMKTGVVRNRLINSIYCKERWSRTSSKQSIWLQRRWLRKKTNICEWIQSIKSYKSTKKNFIRSQRFNNAFISMKLRKHNYPLQTDGHLISLTRHLYRVYRNQWSTCICVLTKFLSRSQIEFLCFKFGTYNSYAPTWWGVLE